MGLYDSAASVPAVAFGVPQEVVAVISAAVYAMYPGAKVKSVHRCSQNSRQSAWRMAGLLESTDPF